jgi:hypothetical protein
VTRARRLGTIRRTRPAPKPPTPLVTVPTPSPGRRSCPVPSVPPQVVTPVRGASLNRALQAMEVWRQIRPNWRLSRPARSFRRSGACLAVV